MSERDRGAAQVPEAKTVVKKRTRLSLVWIVPIVAALAGVWVGVTRILSEGPKITIVLHSAEGLEAGKTKIRYNGVDIGTIMTIRLSDDHQRVIATAEMAPKTEDFFVEGTKFWVVRPRISGANVSGLGTLISGAYFGMEIGQSKKTQREFVALAAPPVVTGDVLGHFFFLETPELGSLDFGTPIYFRRLEVGRVVSYELDREGKSFSVRVFVQAPYDQYVTAHTRFWHASGVDVSLSATGVSVQTQSLLSILVGGIAFETPASDPAAPPAEADTSFVLFANRAEAYKPAARDPQVYRLVFRQSVRGLAPGAPVEFRGIPLGEVAEIDAAFDAKAADFTVTVTVRVDPKRLGVKVFDELPGDVTERRKKMLQGLVARGFRAQLRSGSLLTGALYVAVDFFPDASPVSVDWSQQPIELPTIPGEMEGLEASVGSIVKKLDKVPIQDIGDGLKKAIAELDHTLVSARGTLDSADRLVQPSSQLSEQLGATLEDIGRASRGLRGLADYLEQHPEALVRGKPGEAK
jgi:paraquat-inducible protein B